jgi:DNA-directed RNA polymerase specialized sigma subunit
LKVKARDAVYRYRGRGSSVDGKLYPLNRTKTYQISSLDELIINDETGDGSRPEEAIGQPQTIRRSTEERAFNNMLFDCLRNSLSETENQVITLRLRGVSWKEVRDILDLGAGETAHMRKRIVAMTWVVWDLPATKPL